MTATPDDILRALVDHVHFGGDTASADLVNEWRDYYDKRNAPSDEYGDDADSDEDDKTSKPAGPTVTKSTTTGATTRSK